MGHVLMSLGFGALGVFLLGCQSAPPAPAADGSAAPPPAVAEVPHYAEAFDTARRTLRDTGFILERVDAQAGVITTQPKTTAGILTPWDREQTSFAQELEDLFQRHQRIVRVEFEPPAGQALNADAPATMHIHVVLQRVQIPGHKLEPEAVWQHSYYVDTDLADRQMQPTYAVAWKQDEALATRLCAEISHTPPPAPPPPPTPTPTPPPASAPATPKPSNWQAGEPVRPPAEPAPAVQPQ